MQPKIAAEIVTSLKEAGVGDVPPAPLDSQENKYTFVRYVEKTEGMEILGSPHTRAYGRKS